MIPIRLVSKAAGLLATMALLAAANPARAETENCRDLREKILAMEASSARPPGWYKLDRYLRTFFDRKCGRLSGPSAQREKEWWYDERGNRTATPADKPAPSNAAYATTEEIGKRCATAGSPSVCALMLGVEKSCRSPQNTSRTVCDMLLGEEREPTESDFFYSRPPGLPPLTVMLDGTRYAVPDDCSRAFEKLEDGDFKALNDRWQLRDMRRKCPDLLAALQRRAGWNGEGDPAKFWEALRPHVLAGFGPPGAATRAPASALTDPGFRRMCEQAQQHMNTCRQREQAYRANVPRKSVRDQAKDGLAGKEKETPKIPDEPKRDDFGNVDEQADRFRECHELYGSVVGMCRNTGLASLPVPRRPFDAPAPKVAAAPAKAAPATAASRPPDKPATPPAQSEMSAECQKLVGDYVAAAKARDGARALAGYNALKRAGGCGVLAKVDRPAPRTAAPPANDPRFVARGATPLTDGVVGACDASPAECAARARQLEAGASPAAAAALYMHAINVGLSLGAQVGGVMTSIPTVRTNAPNMNSIGPAPVRNTVGQGSPLRPAPRTRPSDITGTK